MAFFTYGCADLLGGIIFGLAADSLPRRYFYLCCLAPLSLWAALSLVIEGTCGDLLDSTCGGTYSVTNTTTDGPFSRNTFLTLSVTALGMGGFFHAALVTWQACAFGEMFPTPGPGA